MQLGHSKASLGLEETESFGGKETLRAIRGSLILTVWSGKKIILLIVKSDSRRVALLTWALVRLCESFHP